MLHRFLSLRSSRSLQAVALSGLYACLALPMAHAQPGGKKGDKETGGTTGPTYLWTNVDALGGSVFGSDVAAINARGDVLWNLRPEPHLFVANESGSHTAILLLEYFELVGFVTRYDVKTENDVTTVTEIRNFNATDINDRGQIVGWADVRVDGAARPRVSFFYSPWISEDEVERFHWITDPDGVLSVVASRLNNQGVVTGSAYLGNAVDGDHPPFVWTESEGVVYLGTNGTMKRLRPQGINWWGQICGNGNNLSGSWKHTPDVGYTSVFSKDYYEESALGINDNGQVVGNYRSTIRSTAYGYRASASGSITTIKMPQGYPTELNAINSNGDVVGRGWTGTNGSVWRPIIYTDANGIVDLETVGQGVPTDIESRSEALDINDAGQVLIRTAKIGPSGEYLYELFLATPQ